jgi:hypothetical protein
MQNSAGVLVLEITSINFVANDLINQYLAIIKMSNIVVTNRLKLITF